MGCHSSASACLSAEAQTAATSSGSCLTRQILCAGTINRHGLAALGAVGTKVADIENDESPGGNRGFPSRRRCPLQTVGDGGSRRAVFQPEKTPGASLCQGPRRCLSERAFSCRPTSTTNSSLKTTTPCSTRRPLRGIPCRTRASTAARGVTVKLRRTRATRCRRNFRFPLTGEKKRRLLIYLGGVVQKLLAGDVGVFPNRRAHGA